MYPTPAKRLHVVQRSAANIRMLSGRGGIFQRLGLRNTQDVPFEEESRGDALVLNFKADSNNVLREPESTLMRTRAGQEDLRNQHAKGEGRRQGSRIRLCILILVGLGVLMKTGSVGRENDGTSKGQVPSPQSDLVVLLKDGDSTVLFDRKSSSIVGDFIKGADGKTRLVYKETEQEAKARMEQLLDMEESRPPPSTAAARRKQPVARVMSERDERARSDHRARARWGTGADGGLPAEEPPPPRDRERMSSDALAAVCKEAGKSARARLSLEYADCKALGFSETWLLHGFEPKFTPSAAARYMRREAHRANADAEAWPSYESMVRDIPEGGCNEDCKWKQVRSAVDQLFSEQYNESMHGSVASGAHQDADEGAEAAPRSGGKLRNAEGRHLDSPPDEVWLRKENASSASEDLRAFYANLYNSTKSDVAHA